MTISVRGYISSSVSVHAHAPLLRRCLAPLVAGAIATAAAGCATATIEDAVPVGALPQTAPLPAPAAAGSQTATAAAFPPAPQPPARAATAVEPQTATPVALTAEPPPPSSGPRDTGTFPNLNTPQRAAADQFSAAEAQAGIRQLQAKRAAQANDAGAVAQARAEAARLEKLRRTHAADALKEIEGD